MRRLFLRLRGASYGQRLENCHGSSGPKAADELLANDGGRGWRPIGNHI